MVPPLPGSMPPRTFVLHSRTGYVERNSRERAMKYFLLQSYETLHANCALYLPPSGQQDLQLLWIEQSQQSTKTRLAIRVDDSIHAFRAEMALKCRDNRGKWNVDVGGNAVSVGRKHRGECCL